jgi:tetratricopeptide (TPR) repeat protein
MRTSRETDIFRQTRTRAAICVLALAAMVVLVSAELVPIQLIPIEVQAQNTASGVFHGHVRDSSGKPLANAAVFLQLAAGTDGAVTPAQIAHTDSEGAYHFSALPAGAYRLRAEMIGYDTATAGPVGLTQGQTTKIDLTLNSAKTSGPQKTPSGKSATSRPNDQAPQFYDEPQFTVAGVNQTTNSGGHGSETVRRTADALAKATVSLGKDSTPPTSAAIESSLRDSVARNPKDPALHHQLGDIEEKLGHPLEAVRQYQLAAELDPSEPNLFDWGAELLTHRALEPATEVFAKGNRSFPNSARILIALGVAWYARGSYDQATQCLVRASDLTPGNPTPYIFLGKMQSVETTPPEASAERLARFAKLRPDNALANYYYAISLWKQSLEHSGEQGGNVADNVRHTQPESERSARVESLLLKAVHLDPKLAAAHLQLGILYSQRGEFSRAISAYRKAIEVSPEEASSESDESLAEAHYRLAQAYQRSGDKARAQEELKLHVELSKKLKEDTEREQRQVQEFVILLRNKDSASQ